MQADFWHEMWESGKVGFHQHEINAFLKDFWPKLNLAGGEEVLVPLCGKSLDMLWLKQQGHKVLGVELSQKALDEFLAENGLPAKSAQHNQFCGYELPEMKLLCGDFFHLAATDCTRIKAVYDRAAIIALPPKMRKSYAQHLQQILPAGTKILMVIMSYDQAKMPGPPFSVALSEVEALFADYQIASLKQIEFTRKGCPVTEQVLLLTPNS